MKNHIRLLVAFLSIIPALMVGFIVPQSAEAAFGDVPHITVAVSSNVQFVFKELEAAFEDNFASQVTGVFGSSGHLAAQIRAGADFDLFLSANKEYPEKLFKEGFGIEEPEVYAYGGLILWTQNEVDLSKGMDALTGDNIRTIAIPNPITAPYGEQAINALKHYGMYSYVGPRLIMGGSIAQTNQFIYSGAADVGITARSIANSYYINEGSQWVDIDPDAYEPIAQSALVIKTSSFERQAVSLQFFQFLFSDEAREIFEKFGYTVRESDDSP